MPVQKTREVRFGLVMYGGVSLAIYIFGVSREFFSLVRGRGVYRLIKALTASDVVVDVISGTSAGGINGILLSYALANECEFGSCAELWRKSGDIAKLLRNPSTDRDHRSVLDGENYYQRNLEEAFQAMKPITNSAEDASTIAELDLFVTGTDLAGDTYNVVDAAGHVVEVKDHRAVFLLQHRKGRKEHFKESETTREALAKLARITSCFPAAFPPVHVETVEDPTSDFERLSPDGRITLWGQLRNSKYFVDGGVLDNKPFTQTIRAIFFRTAERAVDRRLFYVEPDPERFARDRQKPKEPDFLEPILDSLVGIPGYESIADDLRLIQERNSRIKRFKSLVAEAKKELHEPGRDGGVPTVGIPDDLEQPLRSVYWNSRLNAISERTIALLLRGKKGRTLSPVEQAAVSCLSRDLVEVGTNGLDQEIFEAFDVDFRLRRIFQTIYTIFENEEFRETHRALLTALNLQLHLLKIIRWAAEGVVEAVSSRWDLTQGQDSKPRETWVLIRLALIKVLDDRGLEDVLPEELVRQSGNNIATWLSDDKLSMLRNRLAERLVQLKRDSWPQTNEVGETQEGASTLLRLTDRFEKAIFAARATTNSDSDLDKLETAYLNFAYLDAYIFPMEFASGVGEKDEIETVRISPQDAQTGFSKRTAADKLSGNVLAHFGGFFKKSWRSNDILWGRLDAISELIEQVLTQKRLEDLIKNQEFRKELRAEFGPQPDAYIGNVFPSLVGRAKERISDWLWRLTEEEEEVRNQALKETTEMRCLIIECGQYEVLRTDLEKVWLDDAHDRQGKRKPRTTVEQGVCAMAKAIDLIQKTNDETPYDRPRNSLLGKYFEKEYRAGAEGLFDAVGRLYVVELAARAGLVIENCVRRSVMPSALGSNTYYALLIRWPMWLLYFLARYLQRSSRFGTVAVTVGVTGLVLSPAFWYFAGASLKITGLAFLVFLLLLIMTALLQQWCQWSRRFVAVAVVVEVTGLVLSPAFWYFAGASLKITGLAFLVFLLLLIITVLLQKWCQRVSVPIGDG